MSQKPAKKSIFSKIGRSIWGVIKTAVVFVTFFVGGVVGKTYLQLPPTLEKEKLEIVNNHFNIMRFLSDARLWRKEDYWATPLEFLVAGAGDCEDFSIAKYFTLLELNVPQEKLLITYVKAIHFNQAHMVLTYYEKPTSIPVVLDNLIGEIKPATKRKDLIPVYSFNGKGLGQAKQRGKGRKLC